MSHFFVSRRNIKSNTVTIKDADAWHIRKVLRMSAGDSITVADCTGKVYNAVIKELKKDETICIITGENKDITEPGIDMVLVQGLPKSDKMDFIIQKSVELGVKEIIPLESERVVVKLNGERKKRRLERWRRIALEAAKQCRRALVPVVSEPVGWDKLFSIRERDALALMPWEQSRVSLKSILCANVPQKLYIIIGPEGGFSQLEVKNAVSDGVFPVTLGPRIMRTETAGLAALAMVLYHYDCLGGGR